MYDPSGHDDSTRDISAASTAVRQHSAHRRGGACLAGSISQRKERLMRRRATLPFVLLLGLVFAIGTTPSLLADEGTPGPFGEGLQITTTQQPNTKTERDQAYNILFNHGAYINEEKSE